MAEREHCETAVCALADAQGLVVITPDVVALLIRERADAALRATEAERRRTYDIACEYCHPLCDSTARRIASEPVK